VIGLYISCARRTSAAGNTIGYPGWWSSAPGVSGSCRRRLSPGGAAAYFWYFDKPSMTTRDQASKDTKKRSIMQNRSHAVMAQRVEAEDSLDDFPTPPWATRALMEHVIGRVPAQRLACLEPACGRGDMARTLSEYFASVTASDVHPYGFGDVVDFTVGRVRRPTVRLDHHEPALQAGRGVRPAGADACAPRRGRTGSDRVPRERRAPRAPVRRPPAEQGGAVHRRAMAKNG
jgi:hypothetical protein